MKNVLDVIKETIAFLEKAEAMYDEAPNGELYACLDCRKISANPSEMYDCCARKHTCFAWVEYEFNEIAAALECLRWVLRQVEGGKVD